jgi:putative SOS response-associated peptidase YedK
MCGRYTLHSQPDAIWAAFDVPEFSQTWLRFRITPSQLVAAVRQSPGTHTRELVMLEWVLVPVWAKDTTIGYRLANALMRPIHERMAVILPPERYRLWFDPTEHSVEVLGPIMKPYDAGELEAFPVSTFVNSPKHDGPECIEPLASP